MKESYLFECMSLRGLCADISLKDCGREKCPVGKLTSFEGTELISIHVIMSGKGILRYDEKEVQLHAGDIFVIMPGFNYTYFPNKDMPWSYLWVVVESSLVLEVFRNAGIAVSHPYLRMVNNRRVFENIEKIVFNYEQKGCFSFEELGHFYLLLNAIISDYNEKHDIVSREEIYVHQAIRFINNNAYNIKVEDIASGLAIHTNYFSAVFKKIMGITPKQFITERRMMKAKRLIQVEKMEIKKVSEILGYSNQLQFSKEFKKFFGESPSKFKEKQSD